MPDLVGAPAAASQPAPARCGLSGDFTSTARIVYAPGVDLVLRWPSLNRICNPWFAAFAEYR